MCDCFLAATAELSGCSRDCMACKAKNTYDLFLYRKALQTPVFKMVTWSAEKIFTWESGYWSQVHQLTGKPWTSFACSLGPGLFVHEECSGWLHLQVVPHIKYFCLYRHSPGLSSGLLSPVLGHEPSHWPAGSHPCHRDLCKFSSTSHHFQLKPSNILSSSMALEASPG